MSEMVMGFSAHRSEGSDHLVDGDLQSDPVHLRALFLLLTWGRLRHEREGEKGKTVVVGGREVK